MNNITVIGLGYKGIDGMSVEGYRILFEGDNSQRKIICRTSLHAVAEEMSTRGIGYETMDRFYEEAESFDDAYENMYRYIVDAAKDCDVVLCISGSPSCSDVLTSKLLSSCELNVQILSCPGVSEHIAQTAGITMNPGYAVVPAHSLTKSMINTRTALCITEVDNKFLAGEIKLMLQDFYPDDTKIQYIYGHPCSKSEEICLFDLDRQKKYDFSVNFVILPLDNFEKKLYDIIVLFEVMKILRGLPPESPIQSLTYDERGCSWDREQTHESIRVNMIEEAYEVVEAINNNDLDNLIEELGDMLLQVVFHSQIALETGEFTFSDVVNGVVEKLLRRHPHVFGDKAASNADQALAAWDEVKKQEKKNKTVAESLAGIPKGLSPLTKAAKVVGKAEKAGYAPEYTKFARGIKHGIIDTELDAKAIGELLFAMADAAKQLGYDPDVELQKFTDNVIWDITQKESSKQ